VHEQLWYTQTQGTFQPSFKHIQQVVLEKKSKIGKSEKKNNNLNAAPPGEQIKL